MPDEEQRRQTQTQQHTRSAMCNQGRYHLGFPRLGRHADLMSYFDRIARRDLMLSVACGVMIRWSLA